MTKKIRLTNKIIEDTLVEALGSDVMPIVNFLKSRKNISEFIVAEKTKVEIHQVRNILYRMHNQNLASYKRKKDSKKGYYISYWTFHQKKVKDLLLSMYKEKLGMLKQRLQKEEANKGCFFLCTNACSRLDFEQSTELEFKCPECGTLLQQQDNTRTIDHLRDKIKEIEASM
ncbi:hypothetical protein HZA96_00360 [Candidatus Woesearchaeota archaeon]|nr:hypothetical protein [Candidatus Woesearchaeota archaeon]